MGSAWTHVEIESLRLLGFGAVLPEVGQPNPDRRSRFTLERELTAERADLPFELLEAESPATSEGRFGAGCQ